MMRSMVVVLSAFLVGSGICFADQSTSSAVPPPVTTVGLEAYGRPGNGEVIGKAEFPTKLFGLRVFAHLKVRLMPLTEYNWWWVNRMAYELGVKHPVSLDYPSILTIYNRSTITDDDGNYTFSNVPAGKYFVQFFTDYESDSSRVENNTIYSTNDDDFPTAMTTQRVKLKLRRELDVVAAPVFFEHSDSIMKVFAYTVLGTQTCCEGEL